MSPVSLDSAPGLNDMSRGGVIFARLNLSQVIVCVSSQNSEVTRNVLSGVFALQPFAAKSERGKGDCAMLNDVVN